MTAQELSNLGVCGASSAKGFNTSKGCSDIIEAADSVWLISPSVVIAETQEINLAYIQGLQKAGQLVVVKGINTFEENGSDDAIETLADDTMLLTNKGKYRFMATFTNGLYFNEALNSVEGQGSWRTIIVDKAGRVLLTQLSAGGYRGFETGMIRATKLTFPSNAASLKQGLDWQLTKRYEMDEYYALWSPENLDFDPRQLEPITQVELSLVNAPADTDTTLTVKAVVRRGRKDAVSGALFSQFLNKIDGATSNPTAGDDSATAGTYVLTVPALASGEVGSVQLFDNANNDNVIEITGDGLYKSNIISYTVV
jgi:hypothetical protein